MDFDLGTIVLRKPKREDAGGFIAICADAEAMRYYGQSGASIRSEEDALRQIEWSLAAFEENGGRWVITLRGEDAYIGDIGFHEFEKAHARVEIGYRLKRAYWNKGIITGSIRALLDHGFAARGYNRIEAFVDPRNGGSGRVLVKNGFKLEGRLREYERENGEYVDLDLYSILRREYMAAPRALDGSAPTVLA